MFKDITLGQFFPAESVLHRMDPRAKIVLAMAYIALLFMVSTLPGYAMAFAMLVLAAALSKVPVGYLLRGFKPLLFILAFTFILNILFTRTGEVLVSFWIITITDNGLVLAVRLAVRLLMIVSGTSLLTLTTRPLALTDGLESLLRPLKAVRFPAHEMAMMMTIALRFIPTLAEEAERIMKAQTARGSDFASGSLIQRARSLVPILVPLFISAFGRAEELANAMEARCYNGGEGRTRLKQLKLEGRDYIALLMMGAAIAAATVGGL